MTQPLTLLDHNDIASSAPLLALLPTPTQSHIHAFYHSRDRRMSLASHILKRLAISHYTHEPLSRITISPSPVTKKPVHIPSNTNTQSPIPFNVSHQADLVAVIATSDPQLEVGIDVVCVNERSDHRISTRAKWLEWVDIYAEVFSAGEIAEMKAVVPAASSFTTTNGMELGGDTETRDVLAEAKRLFYAFWCLKEAYIKMTGEALLAPWLRELEFRNVRPPRPSSSFNPPKSSNTTPHRDQCGEVAEDIEIYLRGEPVRDVRMELQAWEEEYMVGTAVKRKQDGSREKDGTEAEGEVQMDGVGHLRGESRRVPWAPIKELDLQEDIMAMIGESSI
ncbi:MAG: hypothetical protein M1817_004525 [Caeruleum heppii]|nr:MAG: hypothetical protein M1817_004525 [Caeruleum heppii]